MGRASIGNTTDSTTEPSRQAVVFGIVVVLALLAVPIAFLTNAARNDSPLRESSIVGVEKNCLADKDGPDYRGQILRNRSFGAENLRCGRFRNARLEDVSFDGSILSLGDFRGAQLVNVTFRDVKLTASNFQRAELRDVEFVETNLFSATFTDSVTDSVTFLDTTCPDGEKSGTSCSGHGVDDPTPSPTPGVTSEEGFCASHPKHDFRGKGLTGRSFTDEDLQCADFRDAHLKDVRFVGTKLEFADFTNATLDRVTFDNAWLGGAWFDFSLMNNVRFEDSNLSAAGFSSVEANVVDFIETVCPDGEITRRSGGNCFVAGEAGKPIRRIRKPRPQS